MIHYRLIDVSMSQTRGFDFSKNGCSSFIVSSTFFRLSGTFLERFQALFVCYFPIQHRFRKEGLPSQTNGISLPLRRDAATPTHALLHHNLGSAARVDS